MELPDGRIEFLVSADKTRIRLTCGTSSIAFADIILTPDQLSRILSRQSAVECEIKLRGLDKVGKTMEYKQHVFEIPSDVSNHNNVEMLNELSRSSTPEGWEPATYFGSQDSFIHEGEKKFANGTIRRWV